MKRRDEVLVGIVATAALALAVVGSLYLARGGLTPGYPVYSVFPWGAGLKQGQPVMLSGVTVGYVDEVGIRRDGHLVVTLRVYKRFQVPKGTTARVVPNGFFGDMMVAMTPTIATDETFAIGDTIPAGPPSLAIGDVIARVDSIGRDVQVLTGALRKQMVDQGGLADIRTTVRSANALIESLGEIAAAQSAELTRTQQSLRRIANAVDSAQVGATVQSLAEASGNVSALASDLRTTTARLNGVLGKLEGSEGSAGLLMNDPGIYRDVRGLLQRLDSLTADFTKNPRKYIKLSIF
ncbi:MAG: MCE family protein [Gemmatimonadales bacterium]|nr:MCE family protein [Gemmatimonadales bacterium]